MNAAKLIRIAMALILALAAWVLAAFLAGGELTLEQAWPSLAIAAASAWTLWRARDAAGLAGALMLTSLLVLFSGLNPSEAATLRPWLNPLVSSLWIGFFALFPFLFVHFTLLFPIVSKVMEGRLWLHGAIYLPYALLLVLNRLDPDELGGLLPVLAYPLGFLSGVAILLHKYRSSLTTSEKNRLWVLLIGCLAGALPRLLTAWGSLSLPDVLERLSEVTLLLFPYALVLAVLRENFSEIGRGFRRLLVWTMVGGGLFNVYLVVFLAVDVSGDFRPESWAAAPSLAAAAAALLSLWPLLQWGRRLISARFDPSSALWTPPRAPSAAREGSSEDGFQPIRPNPFIVGNPVRSPEMFFGREEEFDFIRRRLANEREGGIIVLCGERRSGKTSILYQLVQGRLGSGFVPVFIDMQGLAVSDDRRFLESVSEIILRDCKRHLPGFSLPASRRAADYTQFTGLIESVLREIRRERLLLLVDEYELIEDKVEKGILAGEIFSYLNSLLEGFPRIGLIFTGSRPLEPMSPWQVLLARSSYREISFLGRDDAQALIRRPLRGLARFPTGSVNRLWRLGRGHPFFTQLLGQTLVDVLNERRTRRVQEGVLEEVVSRILEHPPPQLLYQWAGYGEQEKLALSALATLLPSADAFLDPESCRRLLETLPKAGGEELDEARLRMIYEGLRGRRVLDRDQTRYRFTMDLLRLWIRSERNVWNVLNEIA
ncbi:MAG TPA: AAA family ATPase [Acidobacteriota bacterium]|nr:AAA family ATPase [Acidobacteriota bacterium]